MTFTRSAAQGRRPNVIQKKEKSMKKLITTVAIVCAAVFANAATANWAVSGSNFYNGAGSAAAKLTSGTSIYVFDYSKVQQSALFDVFANNTSVDLSKVEGYAGTIAIGTTAGVISSASGAFSYGEQSTSEETKSYSFYLAVIKDDAIYLSKTVSKDANGSSTAASVGFGSQAPTTGASSKSLPTEGFEAVGQWAAAVPEPTSGLLLLLGMAGLALKRKQA